MKKMRRIKKIMFAFGLILMMINVVFAQCIENDDGMDYYNTGTINSTDVYGLPFNNIDRCMPDDDELFPSMLEENYCRNDGMADVVFYDCPNGCKDGECIMIEDVDEDIACSVPASENCYTTGYYDNNGCPEYECIEIACAEPVCNGELIITGYDEYNCPNYICEEITYSCIEPICEGNMIIHGYDEYNCPIYSCETQVCKMPACEGAYETGEYYENGCAVYKCPPEPVEVEVLLKDDYEQGNKINIKVKNNNKHSIFYSMNSATPKSAYQIYQTKEYVNTINARKLLLLDLCLPRPTVFGIGEIEPGETKIIDTWNQIEYSYDDNCREEYDITYDIDEEIDDYNIEVYETDDYDIEESNVEVYEVEEEIKEEITKDYDTVVYNTIEYDSKEEIIEGTTKEITEVYTNHISSGKQVPIGTYELNFNYYDIDPTLPYDCGVTSTRKEQNSNITADSDSNTVIDCMVEPPIIHTVSAKFKIVKGNNVCSVPVCEDLEFTGKYDKYDCPIYICIDDPEPPVCEQGCEYKDRCLTQGTRLNLDDKAVFCGIDFEWNKQSQEGDSCNNNYECSTNLCIDSECVSSSAWQTFLSWISKLF